MLTAWWAELSGTRRMQKSRQSLFFRFRSFVPHFRSLALRARFPVSRALRSLSERKRDCLQSIHCMAFHLKIFLTYNVVHCTAADTVLHVFQVAWKFPILTYFFLFSTFRNWSNQSKTISCFQKCITKRSNSVLSTTFIRMQFKYNVPQRCFYKFHNEIILAIITKTNETLDHFTSREFCSRETNTPSYSVPCLLLTYIIH